MGSLGKLSIGTMLASVVFMNQVHAVDVEPFSEASLLLQTPVRQALSANSKVNGFVPVETVSLPNGKVKTKYRQFYDGVPVRKGFAVSSTSQGQNNEVYGKRVVGLSSVVPSISPSISAQGALQRLKSQYHFGVPVADIVEPENEESTLYVWLDDNGDAKLVYEVSFFLPTQKPTRPHALVDAKTGEIVKTWEGLTNIEDAGQGPGGNEKTGQYNYGSDYSAFTIDKTGTTCTLETANVKTVNLAHGTSGSTAFSYGCDDSSNTNTFKVINGAYSPLNDAHYFGQLVFDMYQDWLNLSPLSFQLVMRVHYSSNYENAFWDGSAMTFGDGFSRFYPLVDVNVSAHEVSHGFTDQNSDLIYSGMSGGINEAFSDIAGEAAEYYWKGSVDWQVGRDIYKNSGALRYFETPSDDGLSIDHANQYYSGLDVHYSSGVFNRAFYLLANTAGWDIRKAFESFAFANKLYWQADSNFDEGGCGVVQAAGDLGYNTTDVINAFSQVGVYACLDAIELTSGTPVSNLSDSATNESYFYFGLPANTDSASVTLSGGTGNADLYVKYNGWPTTSDFDCASTGNNNDEYCDVTFQGSGEYNVLVIAESDYNGATIQMDLVEAPPQELSVGETVSNLSGVRGDTLFYRFAIPDDENSLRVELSGGTGDADLYLRKGASPSLTEYDCRPYYWGNEETCTASGSPGDEFYVMLHGYSSFSNTSITLSLEPQDSQQPEDRADPIDPSTPASNLQGSAGEAFYYSFTVTSAGVLAGGDVAALSATSLNSDNITIVLSGGLGDADLYVRAGQAPTTAVYDCRSISSSNQEACSLSNLSAGVYYVMIYGAQAFEGATLSMNSSSSSGETTASGGGGGGGGGGSMFHILLLILPFSVYRYIKRQ
ncbi:Zn-dependent metalloprotease [Enterovibrio nigricans DSM 22720]|uniref:Zn-dependent metalloprotease n=2 Tax=Enterovibrio nigricans TaxID=504469 RepID=A0A1T4VE73_9GAMM|nr:zinc-dependent metalloprotease [Enterovibrio nigricans]SKA63279.1 Zn-dependent metalloprotease [Enterovibrio nigricans DSM 22720]